MLPNYTLPEVLTRIVAWLAISGLFGFFIAAFARLLGDRGPAYDGKLTPNPFEHLDLLAGVPFVLFSTGWIKPMAIDPRELRLGKGGLLLVVAAALVATVLLIVLLWQLRWIAHTAISAPGFSSALELTLRALLESSIWFALLNLIPVPPLAAGYALRAFAPTAWEFFERYGFVTRLVLIGIVMTGVLQGWTRPIFETIRTLAGGAL